jgi:hypothetical protein
MNLHEIYPRFTVTDLYGRALKYECRGNKYYREWLNPPVEMDRTYLKREISRSQYAYGLLAAVEFHITGQTSFAPDVRVDVKSEAEKDLDEWFGEKRR